MKTPTIREILGRLKPGQRYEVTNKNGEVVGVLGVPEDPDDAIHGALIDLSTELIRVTKERDRLRQFAEYVMDDIWHGNPDDGAIQLKAEQLGIIEERDVDPEDDEWGMGKLYFLRWK